MKFADKDFGSFRNKAIEAFVKENPIQELNKLWQQAYDLSVELEHDMLEYNKSLGYKWTLRGYRDHLIHETNRTLGNINSTIKNYHWYLKEGMKEKAESAKRYLIDKFLELEFYMQSLEVLHLTIGRKGE